LRDELGKKGIVFDVDLLMTPQVVMARFHDRGLRFQRTLNSASNDDIFVP